MRNVLLLGLISLSLFGCAENYSNGERIGMITQFSLTGVVWKSYEGHLNMTQTGMNSSQAFDFSVDNDQNPQDVISILDSAARQGWKVKLGYHEVWGAKNVFNNRGHTDYFITSVEILDKTPMASVFGNRDTTRNVTGRTVDTIYVVIIDKSRVKP